MKLIKCKKNGCIKTVPENIYLSNWKNFGFEIIDDKKQEDVEQSASSFNFEEMDFHELKKLASEKGINTYKMKKEEIINKLKEL